MREFSVFTFESCRLDPVAKRIDLTNSLDEEIRFTETIQLPGDLELVVTPEVERALFALHLAGGVSYYKTCLPPQMRIRSGSLSPEQAAFWAMVYERGLGEFFYQNKIDGRGRVRFPADERGNPPQALALSAPPQLRPQNFLVHVGGGKDS